MPHPVIVRAHEIQARLEVSEINQNTIGQNILGEDTGFRKNEQMDLFEYKKDEIIKELQEIDVMAITPMDAMNMLFLLLVMNSGTDRSASAPPPWNTLKNRLFI